MLGTLGRPGDTVVRAGSSEPLVSAHAVRRADGDLSVMLINKDPGNSYPVSLSYAGFTPSAAAPTVHRFTRNATEITSAAEGTGGAQTIPPYSIMTVDLHRTGGAGTLSAPGRPQVTGMTDTKATVSWPTASGGQIDKYEVYRQFGTTSELLGTSTTTSFTVSNLNPGSPYTLNVLARDHDGLLSAPSAPVSFTTRTPQSSTCSVAYKVTNAWGNGFIGDITITNRGGKPLTGWTLAFSFPAASESVSSGWNGTWTETGRDVRVTPADFNTTLAADGGSANIGFVGANNGAYPSPMVFTLNGTVCTST
jgi:hypothetical protein